MRNEVTEINKDALVLPYWPWIYSTADALLLGFCVQLAGELERRDSKVFCRISSALMGLFQAIEIPGAVPEKYKPMSVSAREGLNWLANVFAKKQQLESINLTNAKDKVQEAIDKTGRPIVIVIDDVDRLPPDEIRLLFQFLKAVADFKGVSYLLAYDPTPVERALSFNGTLDGKEYLKKFVQLPIRLPRISRLLLQKFFRNAIERLSEELEEPFTNPEGRDFLLNHNRQQVIDDKATAGVLRQWLVFLSSVPDASTPIHNPDGIAELLIQETLNPRNDNPTESFNRLVADYLIDLLPCVSEQTDRISFVESIVAQTKNLYVSERLLTTLTSKAGLWAEGQARNREQQSVESDPLPISVESIKQAQNRWLDIVRGLAGTGNLHEQPHLGFILHRWGQFNNNDYSEVQRYVTHFCETNDPLLILRHFDFELDASGLGKIFLNPSNAAARLREYDSDNKERSAAIRLMDRLANQSATSAGSQPHIGS